MSNTRSWSLAALAFVATAVATAPGRAQTLVVTEIRTGEILYVDGNYVVARGPEGVREFIVSDDFRFATSSGEIPVRDLKPGMRFAAKITTTVAPVEVTATEVRQAQVKKKLGNTLVLRLEDGTYKKFTADDMKHIMLTFLRNGREITAWDLKEGDKVEATIITRLPPETMATQSVDVAVAPPAPAPSKTVAAPAASKPTAKMTPALPSAATEKPARALPKTGRQGLAIGLAGAGLVLAGLGSALLRRLLGS
jgi:hypothetical protein